MKKATIIVLLAVMLCGLCSCATKADVLCEEDIQAICDLATLKCYYNNVVKIDQEADNIFQKDRKMWIEYESEVSIGIDMSQVAVDVVQDIVTITLPDACILSDSCTFTENSYYISADGWLVKNEVPAETQSAAVEEAQNEMLQSIIENRTLLNKAEERAKELIENYITQIGEITGREYTVLWKKAIVN